MFNGFFKKKTYQHKIIFTYPPDSNRTRYSGTDEAQAEKTYEQGRKQLNVWQVRWFRNGNLYKHN